jgi:hypothetical protein
VRKRMLIVATLVATCTACAAKHPKMLTTASCVGDSNYEQIKITIAHDVSGAVSDIALDRPDVTIYFPPNPKHPEQKGQVCWAIVPNDTNGPLPALKHVLVLESKDGTTPFKWKAKKKYPREPLEISSDLPLALTTKDGWHYRLKSDKFEVDPVIIVIDDSH